MKIPTVLLVIGTAAALVPQTSAAGNKVFDYINCSKWGQNCPPTSNEVYCCPELQCKKELVPETTRTYQHICRIH
ncbi:hypothetical protein Vi05172_g8062 [Venturia inaequalis]|nr:hypothetical protein Vi05172_g8062 [Venturia inaequalis]